MKKSQWKILLVAVACMAMTATLIASVDWSYHGATGPEHWEDIGACPAGLTSQSPIDIVTEDLDDDDDDGLTELEFDYNDDATLSVFNNSHTVQANVPVGSTLTIGGKMFDLLQFHYHTESEHAVNGELLPVEMHFVHAAADGELAVVGVFYEAGDENDEVEKLLPLPEVESAGDPAVTRAGVDLNELLPSNQTTVRYSGSLTTPPCSEGVRWNVMTNIMTMSADQLHEYEEVFSDPDEFPHGNRRPVQPLNGRTVVTDAEFDDDD